MANYGLKDEKYTMDLLLCWSHEVIAMMKKWDICLVWVLEKKDVGFFEQGRFRIL